MIVRYCPQCREEFQPHIAVCSDCGGALVDHDDTQEWPLEPSDNGEGAEEGIPDAVSVFGSAHAEEVRAAADVVAGAGLVLEVKGSRHGLQVRVARGDREAARAALASAGLIGSDDGAPPVAAEGGPCPACGTPVSPGVETCPECGLQLAGGEVPCPECGRSIAEGEACPACGCGHEPA